MPTFQDEVEEFHYFKLYAVSCDLYKYNSSYVHEGSSTELLKVGQAQIHSFCFIVGKLFPSFRNPGLPKPSSTI